MLAVQMAVSLIVFMGLAMVLSVAMKVGELLDGSDGVGTVITVYIVAALILSVEWKKP